MDAALKIFYFYIYHKELDLVKELYDKYVSINKYKY